MRKEIKMDKDKLSSFLITTSAAIALAVVAIFSLHNLFQKLDFTSAGAWVLGTALAIVPAFFVNRIVTRAYLKTCDADDANEFASFMGSWGTVSFAIIIGLWLGCAGSNGIDALSLGIQDAGKSIGLLRCPEGEEAVATSMNNLTPDDNNSKTLSGEYNEKALTEQTPKRLLPESISNTGGGSVTIIY